MLDVREYQVVSDHEFAVLRSGTDEVVTLEIPKTVGSWFCGCGRVTRPRGLRVKFFDCRYFT